MSDPDPQDERRPRPVAKSATAFRTISEVSAELGVPQHVLRFWETRFPQVKPLKRGGGRRYYRPEDVELLRRIQRLLYEEGYTIKGVQKLLRESRSARPGAPGDLFGAGEGGPEAAGPEDEADDGGDDGPAGEADEADDEADAPPAAAAPGPAADPAPERPAAVVGTAPSAPEPPRLTAAQRGRIQTVVTELRALREILRQALG
jgi:DNA-binding transcriptional MerR regulator